MWPDQVAILAGVKPRAPGRFPGATDSRLQPPSRIFVIRRPANTRGRLGRSTQRPSRTTCSRGLGCELSPHPPELSGAFRGRFGIETVRSGMIWPARTPSNAVLLRSADPDALPEFSRLGFLAKRGTFRHSMTGTPENAFATSLPVQRAPFASHERKVWHATPVRARPGRNPRRPRVVSAQVNEVLERLWVQRAV